MKAPLFLAINFGTIGVQLRTYIVSRNTDWYSRRTNAAIATKFFGNEMLNGIYKIRSEIDTINNAVCQ